MFEFVCVCECVVHMCVGVCVMQAERHPSALLLSHFQVQNFFFPVQHCSFSRRCDTLTQFPFFLDFVQPHFLKNHDFSEAG